MSLVSVLFCSFPTSISIHFIHFHPKLSISDIIFVSDLDNLSIDYQIINLVVWKFVVDLHRKIISNTERGKGLLSKINHEDMSLVYLNGYKEKVEFK